MSRMKKSDGPVRNFTSGSTSRRTRKKTQDAITSRVIMSAVPSGKWGQLTPHASSMSTTWPRTKRGRSSTQM